METRAQGLCAYACGEGHFARAPSSLKQDLSVHGAVSGRPKVTRKEPRPCAFPGIFLQILEIVIVGEAAWLAIKNSLMGWHIVEDLLYTARVLMAHAVVVCRLSFLPRSLLHPS